MTIWEMVATSVGPLLGLSCNKVHVVKGKWRRAVSRTVPSVDWPLAPPFSWFAAAAWASASARPAAPGPTVAIPAFVVLPFPLSLPVSISTSVSLSVLVFLTLTAFCCASSSFHPLLALLFPFFLLFFLLLSPFLTFFCPFCSGSFPLGKLQWKCKKKKMLLKKKTQNPQKVWSGLFHHLFICKWKPVYARGSFSLAEQVIKQLCRGILGYFLWQRIHTTLDKRTGLWQRTRYTESKSTSYLSSPCSFPSPCVASLLIATFEDLPPSLLRVFQTL